MDYIHMGGFKQQAFVAEARRLFATDHVVGGRFTAISIPGMLDLLSRISHDPRIVDVRWIAYMLATAMWETAVKVTVPALPPRKAHKDSRWGTPSEEDGRGRLRAGLCKDYYLKVKVRRLPDGTAEVVENDGDRFTVRTDGSLVHTNPMPRHGAPATEPSTPTYSQAQGAEHTYFGRGYVHLTWWDNYADTGARIGMGLELLFNPERALEPE